MPFYDWFPYEVNKPRIPQAAPYFVELKKNTFYKWCSCGNSKTQPWCTDTSACLKGFQPLTVHCSVRDRAMLLCGCKHSEKRPFCNLTHNYVKGHANTSKMCGVLFAGGFGLSFVSTFIFHP